jgi:hypothetical protein
MTIIDSDYQTLTIKTIDNQILIRNIDEYNLLKYGEFEGKRIIVNLPENVKVVETFDEGIFNVSNNDVSIQLRDRIEICKRLTYCMQNETSDPIKELLLNSIETEIKKDVLEKWLIPFYERVQIIDCEVIIDNIFKVNKDGTAYYKDSKGWNFLCIVVHSNGQQNRIIKHELGEVKIDFKTIEIYNKVLFLLFPNLQDNIFLNQLPLKIKTLILKRNDDLV